MDISINLDDRTKFATGIDDVKQSWNIILRTIPGTIPLLPNFGSNLYKYIDRPVNETFSNMANTIIKDLEYWEKRTKIKKVEKLIVDVSNIVLKIYGIFTPTGQPVIATLNIAEINPTAIVTENSELLLTEDGQNLII
jgi:phage baseplate assembly protein W